jgi:hypothetical protein
MFEDVEQTVGCDGPSIKKYRKIVWEKERSFDSVEFPPCERIVKTSDCDVKKAYSLPFPYTIFIRHEETLHLFFANKPIESFSDEVYFPPLPNIYPRFNICLTGFYSTDEAIKKFWDTSYYTDQSWPGCYLVKFLGRWKGWEKKEDATKIEWEQGFIFSDVLQFLSSIYRGNSLGMSPGAKALAENSSNHPFFSNYNHVRQMSEKA